MLTAEQKQDVKEIVNLTIEELQQVGMLKDKSDYIYSNIAQRLRAYYKNKIDKQLGKALEDLQDDIYINILPMYYKNDWTIEAIAEIFNVNSSTIVRNKKRLCIMIHTMLD